MSFQKQGNSEMISAGEKIWTMILSQTATHAGMENNSVLYPKGHKKQQRDICERQRYTNAAAVMAVRTKKTALRGITARLHLKIETRSFQSQEKWKKNGQNVLNE